MRALRLLRNSLLATACVAAFSWGEAAVFWGGAAAAETAPAPDVTPDQRSQIESVIRDYLVKNPQVLKEALAALEALQEDEQRAALAGAVQAAMDVGAGGDGIVLGNPDGEVTIVEFFDYNCGFCKKALGDMEQLVKSDPRVRFVIRDFPVLRAESVEAALVSIAAGKQLPADKYLRFHSDLLLSRGVIGKARALEVATALGADLKQLEKDIESDETRQALAHNLRLGEDLALTGTPSFVAGDGVIPGAVGLETLQALVTSVKNCGKVQC